LVPLGVAVSIVISSGANSAKDKMNPATNPFSKLSMFYLSLRESTIASAWYDSTVLFWAALSIGYLLKPSGILCGLIALKDVGDSHR